MLSAFGLLECSKPDAWWCTSGVYTDPIIVILGNTHFVFSWFFKTIFSYVFVPYVCFLKYNSNWYIWSNFGKQTPNTLNINEKHLGLIWSPRFGGAKQPTWGYRFMGFGLGEWRGSRPRDGWMFTSKMNRKWLVSRMIPFTHGCISRDQGWGAPPWWDYL